LPRIGLRRVHGIEILLSRRKVIVDRLITGIVSSDGDVGAA
jgi:hypothetical protein